jgi:nucleotide-binding universal stress UspA family protein
MRDADAYLEQVRARLDTADLTVRARCIAGTIAGALLDYAHEESIDLIVLTSHGRTGLARFPRAPSPAAWCVTGRRRSCSCARSGHSQI